LDNRRKRVSVEVKPEGIQKLRWYQYLAFVSTAVLLIALMYPTPIKSKYLILISLGALVYSFVEWTEWGNLAWRDADGLWQTPVKRPNWISRTLKAAAILLILLTIVEIISGITFIPFPE